MLNKFISEDASDNNEINTSIIKIRGRTLVFINSIYQISNISGIRLLDLSRVQQFPKYLVWLIIIGLALLFFSPDNIKIFGVVILAYVGWQFYLYQQNKLRIRHGLKISLNSGERTIIINSDAEFLKQMMLVIYNIMNDSEPRAFTFNLDQRNIVEDKSINIDSMSGSNFVSGNVTGDVVSNV
jgi:Family of unknown function (DUF6232)